MDLSTAPALLTPSEAAEALGVDTKTLARWAKDGRIPHTWTLGGHRRYHRDFIIAVTNHRSTALQDEALASMGDLAKNFYNGKL